MILTNNIIKSQLSNYANKENKISREIKAGKLIKLKKGLYETNPNTPGYLLSASIYGPSYLSFDFALSYYRLIPEKVFNYTSATFGKNKKKKFTNNFGTFLYRDVPKNVYHLGICLKTEGNYTYQIATKEKALCDKLYTLKTLNNFKELENILFNDLRIDEEEIHNLNKKDIEEIAKFYHSRNVQLLSKYLRRTLNE